METQTSKITPSFVQNSVEFTVGSIVIYPGHGKCIIHGVETRQVDGKPLRFYKLEILKSTLSRSNRPEPAIWLPVHSAQERGLRVPIIAADTQIVMAALLSREYYFRLNEPWPSVQPKIESLIRIEGALGLAKAVSYTYVAIKKQLVPPVEIVRFNEHVTKVLFRELSEAMKEPIRNLEEKINRGLRQKLLPDT